MNLSSDYRNQIFNSVGGGTNCEEANRGIQRDYFQTSGADSNTGA